MLYMVLLTFVFKILLKFFNLSGKVEVCSCLWTVFNTTINKLEMLVLQSQTKCLIWGVYEKLCLLKRVV